MKTYKYVAGITLATTAAAAALLGGIAIYTGLYNVSATDQHTAIVYQVLETSLRRSVKLRTVDVDVPALDSADRVVDGFKHFRAHCVQCHGAPGVAPQPFALGLTPAPASLVASAQEWSAAEAYWIIRYGIKMSGMPAWQYRMSDEEIWNVVAFMKALPTLSPADYQRWSRQYAQTQTPVQTSAAPTAPPVQNVRLGDITAGRRAIQQYLCATCHVIPGIVGARHHVGPPLAGIASRQYIAGVLPNTPANMVHWIRWPTRIDPLSAMPDLGVTEQDARDIAAFLYTLRDTD
ncbi:MAG TPA: c-type cytochrome [Eoetvoesiella sp.]